MIKLARMPRWLLLGGLALLAAGAAGLPTAAAQNTTDPAGINFRWRLLNPHPCVRDTVVLVVAGFHSTPCDSFVEAFVRDPTHVVYHTEVRDSIACPAVLPRMYPIPLKLGLFPAGPHRIEIEWVIDHRTPSGEVRTEVRHGAVEFVVSAECPTPRPGPLPYVEKVYIGRPFDIAPPCAPPRDSIAVLIAGRFPNDCYQLVRVEVLPDHTMGPMPRPARVLLVVDVQPCVRRVCGDQPVAWSASVKLPPLPVNSYKLPIQLVEVSCVDPGRREFYIAYFPFTVSESCGAALGCVLPDFDPLGEWQDCDARITPDHPARLRLYMRSPVALSGVQGELAFETSGLRITRLAPTGPAQGMIFRWAPTPRGVKFALVSAQGAPIPPTRPGGPAPAVLEIEVELGGDRPPSPVTLLRLVQYMALDAEGHELLCPTLEIRLAPTARICSAARAKCDFNADGREDIRDLVLMIRCLRDGALCGDDPARFDCNGDGGFTLDDVLCCADRLMLNECAGCPPGETRDARELKIAFGVPAGRERSFDLPIRIERAGAVGAARFSLRFPADRYEVRGVEVAGAAASWLKLWQVDDGRVVVGLIDPVTPGPRTAQDGPGVADFVITLQLALRPGAAPGGEVALEGAEFSAYDGVALATEVPQLRQPLGGTPRIALSESRPNPFRSTTSFALTLDRPGPVDVGIFDLGGRRLVTLHRGELPAGANEFAWDGRLANGTRARDGVYFYRALAGAETQARKLVLLGGP